MKVDRFEWESQIELITNTKTHVFTDIAEFETKLINPLNRVPTG
jgi:hypothetical protein